MAARRGAPEPPRAPWCELPAVTPSEHVEAVLRGRVVDRIPFTMYEGFVEPCAAERELRSRGMCIVQRGVGAYAAERPNVRVTRSAYREAGRNLVRTFHETPAGTLTTLEEPTGSTTWVHERMFKSPADYPALRFFLADERYEPRYEELAEAERLAGGDLIFRAGFGLEPLQSLISGTLMDIDQFALQWMDNREQMLALYRIIVERRRELYPIVARSPVLHANYGGNVIPELIGPAVFREYYLPHYRECAEVMHRHGKLVGCHFDDDTALIADGIAESGLDYIEAFTPAPGTDLSLGEARRRWPGKVLWLNFPSALHLRTDAEVERATFDLLEELDDVRGIIMGITENMPQDRWRDSCRAIMDGLDRHARERPEAYGG